MTLSSCNGTDEWCERAPSDCQQHRASCVQRSVNTGAYTPRCCVRPRPSVLSGYACGSCNQCASHFAGHPDLISLRAQALGVHVACWQTCSLLIFPLAEASDHRSKAMTHQRLPDALASLRRCDRTPRETVRTMRQTVAKNTLVFSTTRRLKNHCDVCTQRANRVSPSDGATCWLPQLCDRLTKSHGSQMPGVQNDCSGPAAAAAHVVGGTHSSAHGIAAC
jgi:hypothetical protein